MKKNVFYPIILAILTIGFLFQSCSIEKEQQLKTETIEIEKKGPGSQASSCDAECIWGSCSVSCDQGGASCSCFLGFADCDCEDLPSAINQSPAEKTSLGAFADFLLTDLSTPSEGMYLHDLIDDIQAAIDSGDMTSYTDLVDDYYIFMNSLSPSDKALINNYLIGEGYQIFF